jgi:hypothetical protein
VSAPKRIHSRVLHAKLVELGIIRRDDYVRRLIIDAHAEGAVVLHVERFGDERLLELVQGLDGIEVRYTDSPGLAEWERELLKGES